MTAADAPGIEFRGVSKRYGAAATAPLAVDDVSFVVARGTLTTLLGPSGCGKTTTLRMIAGLEDASSGRILIEGHDVTALGPGARNVSMVFQSYALFPHMDVLANVAYGLRVARVAKERLRARAEEALALVGLEGFAARLPAELSGGQQQRVALARALVLEPAVLLFDEPLSNLDARLRRTMRDEIRALQLRLGLTVAYVTHDQTEALAVSDRIIVMNQGRIAQEGTPEELYRNPASAFVAGFMGEAMLFDLSVGADGSVRLGPIALPGAHGPAGGAVKAAVRPEAWRVLPAGAGPLAGSVERSTYLGSVRELTIATALGTVFVVAGEQEGQWRAGDAVSLDLSGHGVSIVAA